MATLLLLIFVLVLIFALLPNYTLKLSKKLLRFFVDLSDVERLQSDRKTLNEELRAVNMIDEFPRYARTERKLIKVDQQLGAISKQKTDAWWKITLGVKIALNLIQGIVFLSLILTYRSVPVTVLPPDWISPLGWLIAFPTRETAGAVSVTFWLIVCRSVVSKLQKQFKLFSASLVDST